MESYQMIKTAYLQETRTWVLSLFVISAAFASLLAGCSAGPAANAGIPDSEITSGVEVVLEADPRTAPYDISVSTIDGNVKLAGAVSSSEERSAAEEVAGSARGVVAVDNRVHFGSIEAR
jgi:hypothetical protein